MCLIRPGNIGPCDHTSDPNRERHIWIIRPLPQLHQIRSSRMYFNIHTNPRLHSKMAVTLDSSSLLLLFLLLLLLCLSFASASALSTVAVVSQPWSLPWPTCTSPPITNTTIVLLHATHTLPLLTSAAQPQLRA